MGQLPQTIRIDEPRSPNGRGLVLTHGAGSNCDAPLLRAAGLSFADAGWFVMRVNMAYRDARPSGPPHPAGGANDRESLRAAMELLRGRCARVWLGGHSYGGRQASMLAAESPGLAEGLLLLSYPLHPPDKPTQLRTAHFPSLATPSVFVHGSKDLFGSIAELEAAVASIPAPVRVLRADGAGHDLRRMAPALFEEAREWLIASC